MDTRVKKRILQILIIIIILIIVYYPGYRRVQEVKAKNRELENKIDVLKEENLALEKKLELLNTDMVYIEKRAREKLGIVREGEIIYEFVPSQAEE